MEISEVALIGCCKSPYNVVIKLEALMSISPFLTVSRTCDQTLSWVIQELQQVGLAVFKPSISIQRVRPCMIATATNPFPPLPEPAKTACGGTINNTDAWPSAIYDGKLVYFCSQACLRVFQQYPDDFMAGGIEHRLDED